MGQDKRNDKGDFENDMTPAKAFGEQNPTQGETAVSWQTWSDGAAGIPDIDGDADWGKLKLDLSGEEGRSAVYDLGSSVSRKFTLSENRYGTGEYSADIQIRGSDDSFGQDDVLPSWNDYIIPITQTWRYVQVRVTTSTGRLGLLAWSRNLRIKADIDSFVTWATGRFTDLYVFVIDDGSATYTWMGSGTYGTSSAYSVEGKTPWAYMYDSAHAQNIRVHAWIWLSHFNYWGGTVGIDHDIPDNDTYKVSGTGIWNFGNPTARAKMIQDIKDFVTHNNVDGLNLNHESTASAITEQDFTDFITELGEAIPNIEISIYTGASASDDAGLKMDIVGLASSGKVHTVCLMGYFDALQYKREYWDNLGIGGNRVICGLGVSKNETTASDVKFHWLRLLNEGFRHFLFFIWEDHFETDSDLRQVIDDYLAGTLTAIQDPITKITGIPGTSWKITVNGEDQETTYVSVSDHVYSGLLKDDLIGKGFNNPGVIYYRNNSEDTSIIVGELTEP